MVSNLLKRAAMRWAHASVKGLRIQIPWDTNLPQYGKYHFAFAKGRLQQIIGFAEANCPHRTRPMIEEWMKGKNQWEIKVGIDCVGYVYNVMDEACELAGVARIAHILGYTVQYTDVNRMTPVWNHHLAERLSRASEVQPGDLMRFDNAEHVAVVIDTVYNSEGRLMEVWYTHANQSRGPHIGWIHVSDPHQDLGHTSQSWHDDMWDNQTNNGLRDRRYSYVCRTHFYKGPRPSTTKRTGLRVFVDGAEVHFPVPSISLNGHTIVRVRTLADAMGAYMEYSDDTEVLRIQRQGRTVECRVGSEVGVSNGRGVVLEQTPELRAGWLYAPLRFVAEALGYQVGWDAATSSIQLRSP